MDYKISEEQKALVELAHDFAEKEIRPVARELDREPDPLKRFPWDVLEKGSKLGLRTLALPVELGGAGADVIT